jgi:hypothetical protein
MSKQRVVILGASQKKDAYAYKAMKALLANEHDVVLVNPGLTLIEERPVLPTLSAITEPVDTLTMYVRPVISSKVADDIVALKPGRVIFNPGTENAELQAKLTEAEIPCENACTLVLLRTGQF